ncbi:MAG: type II secretion system protein [Planctomycetota bacterium]|jgi:prepilin-type N-terminal cleavage/methylation domain-containing protein|nr:type II secretion system protein [Planctomycetota bacterium]
MDPTPAHATPRLVKQGFTLIELLVVIAIILILAGLVASAASMMRRQARWAVTAQRASEALRAVSAASDGPGGKAATLHRRLAMAAPGRVDGVITFKNDRRFNVRTPANGSWISKPYAAHYFAFPWGKAPTDLPGDPSEEPDPNTAVPIESHALDDLSATFSAELFAIADLLPLDDALSPANEGILAYHSDRNPERPWNDAWGRPLVLAAALYQPQRNTSLKVLEVIKVDGGRAQKIWRIREDLFVRKALDRYGYARAWYLAVGAAGPQLRNAAIETQLANASADWTSLQTEIWQQACAAGNHSSSGQRLWHTDANATPPINAFVDPPFQSHRHGRRSGHTGLVTAPIELR